MAIPKYNELYGTFLECLKDGNVHTLKEIKDAVIKEFNLTEEDIQEMLPSGRQRVYENRIGWCRQYLKKANCITTPARAQFLITARGQNLLSQKININDDVLMQFPEFAAYKGEKCQKETATNDDITQLNSVEDESTPQEILDHAYEEVNDALAVELLDEVRNMDPYKFEQLVVDLLIKMGYGKLQYGSRTTKKSGDEGIDGIVTADKLGFDSVYIQAKRFKDVTVGSPEVQKFVGALAGQGATKGIFITTSSFSRAAEEYAAKNQYCKIVLVDGKRLSELMLEYEIGVSTAYVYKIRKIDTDYFVDE